MLTRLITGIFIGAVCLYSSAGAAELNKTKIAVMDFEMQGQGFGSDDIGKIVPEWLITALVKTGRFDVIERRLLDKILKEQELGQTGIIDKGSATKLGQMLGAHIIITGTVMKLGRVTEVNARIVDVKTGTIMAAEKVKSSDTIMLEDLVARMAEKIISDFPLEGYVTSRNDQSVFIDAGQRSGIKRGMRFIVYKEGTIVRHPKTGEVLDVERIEMGEIEATDVRGKISECRIVRESSVNAITEGHLVKSIGVSGVNESSPVLSSSDTISTQEPDTDRPGMDYRGFNLTTADSKLCSDACLYDSKCRAWTYVRPGVQGPSARCWLKDGVPQPGNETCCISGVISRGGNDTAVQNISEREYVDPRINGRHVDNCLNWAENCQKPAADYYCRQKGYAGSVSFNLVSRRPTWVMGDNKICDYDYCVGFSRIVCGN